MASAVAPAYTISIVRPSKEKDDEGKYLQSEDDPGEKAAYGNFRVSKQFHVENNAAAATPANGFVIQMIEKTPNITAKEYATLRRNKEYALNDSKSISSLTKGRVQYMTSKYFEVFLIKEGLSVEIDSFQNGSICSYDDKGFAIIEDVDPPSQTPYTMTKGTIVQKGVSIFISLAEKDLPKSDNEILKKLPDEIKNLRVDKMGWSASKETPANGLLYLPWSPEAERKIRKYSESNRLDHTVRVTWDYPESRVPRESKLHFSQVVSDPPLGPASSAAVGTEVAGAGAGAGAAAAITSHGGFRRRTRRARRRTQRQTRRTTCVER
jgi:hypothetical protein